MKAKLLQFALLTFTPQIFATLIPEPKSSNHLLSKRSVTDILLNGGTTCGGNTSTEEALRFNVITFNSFDGIEGLVTDGPIASGNIIVQNGSASINTLGSTSDCSNVEPDFGDYGLIVRRATYGGSFSVRGEISLSPIVVQSTFAQAILTCPTNNYTTNILDFEKARNESIDVAMEFSTYQPSLFLNESGNLVSIGNKTNGYDVITMNTCNEGNCDLYPGKMSDPSAFLFNASTWNGPVTGEWPSKLIVNIPIDTEYPVQISTTHPSIGMRICSTIWNFYPSDQQGSYDPRFIWIQFDNEYPFGGFILMPEGTVQIRGTGGTAGTVLARTYLATVPNTHIHNFKALDENCNFFNDCNAIDNCSPAVTTVSITTTQESVIITPTIDFTTLTVTEFDTAAATTTAVIIIPELKSVKHWEQDGGYHKKDEDDEDLDEDDCEEDQ